MAFMPLSDEIDPMSGMQRWLGEGGRLAVPVSTWNERTMEAREVISLDEASFDVTRQGIREPRSGPLVPKHELSAIVVPGLAFDSTGGRLGRGAGFYDRYFTNLPPACLRIGVCHARQLVTSVPQTELDQRVDCVLAV